jgi:hypothetical protein
MRQKKTDYSELYVPADTFFEINNLDPDRKTIVLSLPKPPKLELIDGFSLHPDEQYFRRFKTPAKLLSIERDVLRELQDIQKSNRQETVTGYKIIDKFWDKVEEERDDLENEIDFIRKIWYFRFNGYWFFNDGKPTYITGRHFMFLNFFYQPDIKENDGYPEYRDRHRREFLFREYLRHATETFAKRDERGWAISNDDGGYDIVDVGSKVSYGDIEPKNRRNGSTMMGLSDMIEDSERAFGVYSTIISKDGDSTEEAYNLKLLPAWVNRPYFIKPVWQGSSQPTQIKYFPPKNYYTSEALMSIIDYTVSAGETKKDGSKFNGFLLMDEEGKCLGFSTPIIMYDGNIKQVQDIVNGDLLMGDDGTPRLVSGCIKGSGELYEVKSKFGSFVCNKDHILSLRTSQRGIFHGVGAGEIVNISISEVLSYSPNKIRNLKLYRKPIFYADKTTNIDPYWLGLWLGDGSHGDSKICNIDKEILRYCEQYADKNGWTHNYHKITFNISDKGRTAIDCIDKNGNYLLPFESIEDASKHFKATASTIRWRINHNKTIGDGYILKRREIKNKSLYSLLKEDGLFKNKHIPNIYLKNSYEKRLQLLAGIIDTDGSRHATKDKLCYEITQKREELSNQIVELANSLGFYATKSMKRATMKRSDGSLYECNVSRIRIYGDLYNIPVKVERKKYLKPEGWRNRNANVSWLKIKPIGIGDYYGFALDGNHLFLLGNQIVVHNTQTSNVLQRWDINKNALALGDGTKILGYSSHVTTVEDINAAGMAFLDMLELSDFYQRGDNGQTISGLMAHLYPAYDGLEGFIDRFGYSVIDSPTDRQKRLSPTAIFTTLNKGAKQYQQEKRDDFLKQGTPAALQSYRAYVKKYPWKTSELYISTISDMGFDYEILDKRIMELRKMKSLGKMPYRTGNFYREGDPYEGNVYWKDEPEGKFELSIFLKPEEANLKRRTMVYDVSKGQMVPAWEPVYKSRYTCGADPFRYKSSRDISANKQSDGGIAVLWHDFSIQDKSKSRRFVASYRHRPESLDEYCEDVLRICEWLGALCYPENNLTGVIEYFIKRGRGGYLKYDTDPMTGRNKTTPGYFAGTSTINDGIAEIKDYIAFNGADENHLSFLEEVRGMRSVDDLTNNDRFAAHMASLLGARSSYGKINDLLNSQMIDLGKVPWLKKHSI